MYKGVAAKTCGKSGCRIVDRTASRIDKTLHIKNTPHYSSFSDFYQRLRHRCSSEFDTLPKFRKAMYTSYITAKSTSDKVTLFISDSELLSSSNCKWVPTTYVESYDFTKDKGSYHTLMLADELNTSKANVLRAMKKLDNFGQVTYKELGCPGFLSRPYKAYFMNEQQYARLRDVLKATAKKKSDNIYLMKCEQYHKIGVSTNVSARLSALDGSTPFDVSLIYTRKIDDALLVESILHKKYIEFNKSKEWFKLSQEQVKEIIAYLDNQP